MIKKAERKILIAFDYNMLIRDYILTDRIGLFLEAVKPLIKKGYMTKFKMYILLFYFNYLDFALSWLIFHFLIILLDLRIL